MMKDNDTFLVQLTVGDLIEILKEAFPILEQKSKPAEKQPENVHPLNGRLVYGIRGIQELFNVSHKTACEWKSTWLAPAVRQCGRKIVTDADYALKLFGEREKERMEF
jgi:hypothetical protein